MARDRGFELWALSVDYGQRHRRELEAARRVAQSLGVTRHWIQALDLAAFGGSALVTHEPLPLDRDEAAMALTIPSTYVPARNTVLLALALALAESQGAADLFIGVNAVDYSGYPDCRPEFIAAFARLANLATKAGVEGTSHFRVHTPLVALGKADIIRWGLRLGVDFALTHSCYDPNGQGQACGRCDSCRLRRQGFAAAGLTDPVEYVA